MLAHFTDDEMVARCGDLAKALSKSDLVNGSELYVINESQTSRMNLKNEAQVSWNLPKSDLRLVSPLHYIDEDGIRVDLNISVNKNSQVVEVNLWKYADQGILKFPDKGDLEVQREFG